MILSIIIYHFESGITAYSKILSKMITRQKVEQITAFFTAIQGYATQFATKQTDSLKTIEFGDMKITFYRIHELKADICLIYQGIKEKKILEIQKEIKNRLLIHIEFIRDNFFNIKRFTKFVNKDVLEILQKKKYKKYISPDFEEMLHSSSKEVKDDQINQYKQEEEELYNRLVNRRPDIELIEQLKDVTRYADLIGKDIVPISNDKKNVFNDIKRKVDGDVISEKRRLEFYIKEVKSKTDKYLGSKSTTLRDIYVSLYSFSKKLKAIGNHSQSRNYLMIAKNLIEKGAENNRDKLHDNLKKLLHIDSEVENFFILNH